MVKLFLSICPDKQINRKNKKNIINIIICNYIEFLEYYTGEDYILIKNIDYRKSQFDIDKEELDIYEYSNKVKINNITYNYTIKKIC